ncbi:uncharacterized protein involved in exopolysaccharide biosynthesis [Pedobacter cryoconitis]|uniref:Uncharacterized protein involved in exopolysaccharide biosynthesis n=1 Tax=Pedobacter cryoconitis TaxID=188932 RepID=A0A7W8ZM91_9SPHI|nr:lipopolysaccharide biosynthesis protein [Pedobacter cryoconitis]MBB5636603.1 uncharacterized protein involved in exopolysaccharide biosynthesis [Pedobacter cryoconitis]
MEEKSTSYNEQSDEISMKELLLNIQEWYKNMLSKWLIIVLFGLLGGLLGFVYAYYKKPVFTASTTFVLEESGSGGALGGLGGLASMVGVDIGGGGGGIFQGDNILELYKSRTMIEKTLLTEATYDGKKDLLVNWYISFNKLRENWKEKPLLKNLQFNNQKQSSPVTSRLRDSVLSTIVSDINKNYLTVSKEDKKLSIIDAKVKSKSEFFSKAFNETIVKNVNDFYVQTKTKKSMHNIAVLQKKTDSVRAVMTGAIYSAAGITDATPNLNTTRQSQRVAPVQRSQFTAETNRAILIELTKNLELTKMSLLNETPLIQVIDEPIYPLPKEQFGKLKGIILGGLIAGILTVIFITIRTILKNIISE